MHSECTILMQCLKNFPGEAPPDPHLWEGVIPPPPSPFGASRLSEAFGFIDHLCAPPAVEVLDPPLTLYPLRRGGEGMEGWPLFGKGILTKTLEPPPPNPDGSHRILVIEVNTKGRPLLKVNVYMPSRNGGDGTEYDDTLSELSELFYKFGPTHEIILLGDMNASIHRLKIENFKTSAQSIT